MNRQRNIRARATLELQARGARVRRVPAEDHEEPSFTHIARTAFVHPRLSRGATSGLVKSAGVVAVGVEEVWLTGPGS